jgi:hypothetical protein
MFRIFFTMLLIVTGNTLFAQYIHYSDDRHIKANPTAKPLQEKVVYHEWPDRCPGLSGSIPVLTNYVPAELVPKLTEIYKGHLYSISSIKVANNKVEYKLKVCVNGEIKFEYADETGNIITK